MRAYIHIVHWQGDDGRIHKTTFDTEQGAEKFRTLIHPLFHIITTEMTERPKEEVL